MTEPAYVYAINANDGTLASYPDLLDNSLRSLRPHLDDPEQVRVIYVPPYDRDHIASLRDRGYQVIERDPYPIDWRSSHKLYLTDIDADDVLFLDADTVIYNDPARLFERDFCFGARPDPCNIRYGGIEWSSWIGTFDRLGLTYLPMFTTGCMAFRDGVHRELREPWERYWHRYLDGDFRNPVKPGTEKYVEMLAFALAISEVVDIGDVWFQGREQQAIERYGDDPHAAVVYELQRLGGRSWSEITAETERLIA